MRRKQFLGDRVYTPITIYNKLKLVIYSASGYHHLGKSIHNSICTLVHTKLIQWIHIF